MSTISVAELWEPNILGRNRLDAGWWSYLVEAPFDMPANMAELMGARVALDGNPFGVRGTVPNMPPVPITKGDPIQILVLPL